MSLVSDELRILSPMPTKAEYAKEERDRKAEEERQKREGRDSKDKAKLE